MDIWRNLPPLAALRAFAAWAETGSMTAAGQALNVSHAAISQQIRALESHLGLSLLDRSGPLPQITTDGQVLAQELRAGFGGMARVVAELTGADALRPVQLTLTQGFASSWLLPRLPDFRKAHPGVELRLDSMALDRPLVPGGVDLSIRFGRGDWPDLEAQPLVPSAMIVVGTPDLAQGVTPGDFAALARLPWLTEPNCPCHTDLLARHGQSLPPGATVYLPAPMLLQAVREGQGLALAARLLIEEDLAAGRLVMLAEVGPAEHYWLVQRLGPLRPAARVFARWLMKTARQSFAGSRRD
ncbi:LysR family transcriptional regulator [Neotabrizicola sp. VNH66]|uniref:LysR family transcriptional regulator n=1 Tax=Neotabrizicola sp. VNH66 TaxID=3400918 RepID=UPI003C06AEB0